MNLKLDSLAERVTNSEQNMKEKNCKPQRVCSHEKTPYLNARVTQSAKTTVAPSQEGNK